MDVKGKKGWKKGHPVNLGRSNQRTGSTTSPDFKFRGHGGCGDEETKSGPLTRMQSERAMNALTRRNQSAAEHQECCFGEALPDADGKAHASQEEEEAGVEMKRPGSGKPRSIFLSLFPFSCARCRDKGWEKREGRNPSAFQTSKRRSAAGTRVNERGQ